MTEHFVDQSRAWADKMDQAASSRKGSVLFLLAQGMRAKYPPLRWGAGPQSAAELDAQQTQIRGALDRSQIQNADLYKKLLVGFAIIGVIVAMAASLATVVLATVLLPFTAGCYCLIQCMNLLEQHHAKEHFFGSKPVPPSHIVWLKKLTREPPNSPARMRLGQDVRHTVKLAAACAAIALGAGAMRGAVEYGKKTNSIPVPHSGLMENTKGSR
jgi:hypothetical protein